MKPGVVSPCTAKTPAMVRNASPRKISRVFCSVAADAITTMQASAAASETMLTA
jgi:hypothetical protein